jgi:membrane protease YdiL (CAAX protease family)
MWLYFKLALSIGIEQISYLSDFQKHNWPLWSAFILICLFPGIFEELAFRGYIMTSLEKVGGFKEALIIQAAMFSILHMLPTIFISHFVMGLLLGLIRQKTMSLYPGILFHTVWNAVVLVEELWR